MTEDLERKPFLFLNKKANNYFNTRQLFSSYQKDVVLKKENLKKSGASSTLSSYRI